MKTTVELERATMEGMPAPMETQIAGWRIRIGSGTIGRINSAVGLGHLPDAPETAVDAVEEWFHHRASNRHSG